MKVLFIEFYKNLKYFNKYHKLNCFNKIFRLMETNMNHSFLLSDNSTIGSGRKPGFLEFDSMDMNKNFYFFNIKSVYGTTTN